jgi:tetratricopeptide (TPR) repeat protein
MVFTQVRRFDDAIGDLTRAIEIDPKNVKAYAMRAEARLQAEANDDALSDVNQALEIANNDPLSFAHQGTNLRGAGPA